MSVRRWEDTQVDMFHKQEKYGIKVFVANMYEFPCVLVPTRVSIDLKSPIIYHKALPRACYFQGLYWGLYVYSFI